MKIVIDTREQRPFLFRGMDAEPITGTLPTGDYSLPGAENLVTVERKELSDLLGCLTHDRERFVRELERMRGFESAVLVIEGTLSQITAGQYRSRMRPVSAIQSLIAIQAQYRLPVFFAEDRKQAEQFVFDFLRHYRNMARRRYSAFEDPDPMTEKGKASKCGRGAKE